ncbi:UNVERIFIED_CONTAM: hypothetical protein GTU68_043232 [Idotea baltica]|nr:hypothetical protein [Idotea baltica]
MLDTAKSGAAPGSKSVTKKLDAFVVGAGVGGLYQLYQLRKLGLKVEACDAASDVGGTWYWNRYPGAKFDSDSIVYQYLFDESLYKDWTWSERFPSQPEIERWMHYITDRLDLRKDITFNAAVTKASYQEDAARWIIETSDGEVIDAKYLVCCTGMLSAPLENRFKGQDTFQGDIFHTARYPKDGMNFLGKRVGVIGTGATGIQVIQTIAPEVDALKVFVRTPQYTLPMTNPKYGPKDVEAYKQKFAETTEVAQKSFSGFEYDFQYVWAEHTAEERAVIFEQAYQHGSLFLWLGCFAEMFFDEEISAEVSAFVRKKMEDRLSGRQDLIDALVPQQSDYGFGTHRVPLETQYLETYLRKNVEAVSVRENAIAEIVPEGVKLADGTVHEVDVIIMATGFDAGTGALSRIDIRGRDNMQLGDEWAKEIRTTLGMQKYGFPNLFMTGAPLAPSAALCNMTTCLQQQTEWISDCIGHLEETGQTIEPTLDGEAHWVNHHDELAGATLLSKTNSWYNGANVEGKATGRVLSYCGGVGGYRAQCEEIAQSGYTLFKLSKAPEIATN